jgi:uncharacterized protein (DUF1501 family)
MTQVLPSANGRDLTRRAALLGLTAAATLGRASLALAHAPTDSRFVAIILRGALDGLAAVAPYGDPALRGLRGELALAEPRAAPGAELETEPGAGERLLDLGGFYGLHPALEGMHAMYRAGELLAVHAVAGPSRTRSHFEGQDCLESGADHLLASGWLNRAVQAFTLPAHAAAGGNAVAVGYSVPLLLRGPATVGNWAPPGFPALNDDLYARVAALHRSDPVTGPAIAEALRSRAFAEGSLPGGGQNARGGDFPALAAAAGRFLAAADGPRVAALELGGWDTHADQVRRLRRVLKQLDHGLAALRTNLGGAWSSTAVLVMTEFGRSARANGTGGTDHGTGTVAFVLGGAVLGGQVRATWPGLGAGKLLDDRDQQPTTDLRSIAKGLLAEHFGLSATALAQVFPGSASATPMSRLVRV